ncbi:MAG: MATE family efflux transporter, partial [Clostridia bacterium]|nr:MATE family efflux transporter [Clostridia bacterium]
GAEGELLENCVVYGRIVLLALPFLVLQFLFQSFFVAAEKPRMGLWVIVAAGVTNMVLDAVLVTALPQAYRLVGAAVATAMSQFVGGFVPLVYFFRKNTSLFRLGKTRLDFRALVKACINGSSEFMSNVSMSIVGMLYNVQLLKYAGEDGFAAYGVMMYVSFIFAAVFIGYSIGTAPVISYHNGAGNHRELKGILKKSLILLTFGSVLMLVAAELLARPLALIFVSYSESLMEMTVYGFRIFAFSFLFMGFAIFGSGFFTALNEGLTSALISFLRSLVFQIGAVLLLPMIWEIEGVWISVVVADLMAVILSFIFMAVKRKKYHY